MTEAKLLLMVSLHTLYDVLHVHHIKSHTFISAVQLKVNLRGGHENENKKTKITFIK